jgi:transposase InsO family protein
MEAYQAGEGISEIARRYGVSRKAVYKWIDRYEEYGEEGLKDLSRAPQQHPGAVSELWRERICGARQEHQRWGAPKLHWWLEQKHGKAGVPSISTIGRVLQERGLIGKRNRRVRAQGNGSLSAAEDANDVWGIDFKGWCRTRDGQRFEPLTLSDYATRYILCSQGMSGTRTEQVRPVVKRVFQDHGLPLRLRHDNGPPFASIGACGLTELSVEWMELGIVSERIAPGHPQQNGRHERMHRTLKEATMQPPAGTWRAQQRRVDDFVREFNEQRPHQALGQQVPAALYRPSERRYPDRIRGPEYPNAWKVRRVNLAGQLTWPGTEFFVSHALSTKYVGLEPWNEDCWRLWFYRQWIGVWDAPAERLWRPQQWEQQSAQPVD